MISVLSPLILSHFLVKKSSLTGRAEFRKSRIHLADEGREIEVFFGKIISKNFTSVENRDPTVMSIVFFGSVSSNPQETKGIVSH